VLDSLIDLYFFEQDVILKLFNDRARDHADHREILKSIGKRDPTGSRRAMKRHLTDVKAVIAGRLEEGESVDVVLSDHLATHPTA
jgi:GntR family transcriptional repressor for pyruvate dehydrogenase complex